MAPFSSIIFFIAHKLSLASGFRMHMNVAGIRTKGKKMKKEKRLIFFIKK